MSKVEIGGVSIHYEQTGEGPDLVLLHGLAGNLAFWYPSMSAGLGSAHRVTALDLRGHGYSSMPESGYTTLDMAHDLGRLLDYLRIEKVNLVGHSYGGAVALHFAVMYPEQVTSLVLADVRIRSLQPDQNSWAGPYRDLILTELTRYGLTVPKDSPDFDWRVLEALAQCRIEGAVQDGASRRYYIPFLSGSRRSAKQWLELVRSTSAVDDFTSIAGLTPQAIKILCWPTLALYGEWSHCLATQRLLLTLLPNCRAGTIARAGHFYPIVQPLAFAEAVRDFLRQVDLQPELLGKG